MKKPTPYEPRQEPDSHDAIGAVRARLAHEEVCEERFRSRALAVAESGDHAGAMALRSTADSHEFDRKSLALALRTLTAMEPYRDEVAKLIVELRRRDRAAASGEAA